MCADNLTLIAAASFEERSVVETERFLIEGGNTKNVYLASVVETDDEYTENLQSFERMGIRNIVKIDRFNSQELWAWSWETISNLSSTRLIIDITCFPRELLGMILYATSLMREKFKQIEVHYVSAPENAYATSNMKLDESDRWLSKGVTTIRTILGFPGMFSGEKESHLIALVGHEGDRLFEVVEHIEPSKLTISSEREKSSTSASAGEYSKFVADELRRKIKLPKLGHIDFRSNSIESMIDSLSGLNLDFEKENICLTAMNTKISFVGVVLFALIERRLRLLYAVPTEYNPKYCDGIGEALRFDITELIKQAHTNI